MKTVKEMTPIELASFICETLENKGIKTTLSGGFCTQIYNHGLYTSYDIDFINHYNEDHKTITKTMINLGFSHHDRYFTHPDATYAIEFPTGPLAIGEELIKVTATIETEVGILRLLTVTDAIKDRLASYYHWDSEQTLKQALMVAKHNEFDLENIREWSEKEGCLDKFNVFSTSLDNPYM